MKRVELEKMYNKGNIIQWFKNYKTFCYNYTDVVQIKHDFLVGEYREIKYYTKSKKLQKRLFEYVKTIIREMEENKQ